MEHQPASEEELAAVADHLASEALELATADQSASEDLAGLASEAQAHHAR